MITDWTPAVTRALAAARLLAEQAEPQPRHLLLALLLEEEGKAAAALQQHGLVIGEVRTALGGSAETVDFDLSRVLRDPSRLSAGFERLLKNARRLAQELAGETTASGEHLLLAILQHDSQLQQTLRQLNLDVARLEEQLRIVEDQPLVLDEPLELVEPTEQIDLARILDANADRAREALRVVEDYCRFALDDAHLSGEWKRLRHDLAEALAEVRTQLLLESRDTQADVGTTLSTASEEYRASLRAVVTANAKRLQEALRSLEEYGKVHDAKLGRVIEQLRYRSYILERAMLLTSTARQRLADVRLYLLVTGASCTASMQWTIEEAVAGGVQMVQLREKQMNDRELLHRAREVRRWSRKCGVPFIMNDRPDIARLAEADGVHVGQEELSVKDARRIIGPDALIGVSTHTIAQARQAVLDGASYIGVGPTFPSATKTFEAFAGLEFVRQVAAGISLPAFAIGGINTANVDQVAKAGLRRVAVSNAICQSDDPRIVAASLREAMR